MPELMRPRPVPSMACQRTDLDAFSIQWQDVLKEAWVEWRLRAYDLAVEDCQKWLRTCEHLRGCILA